MKRIFIVFLLFGILPASYSQGDPAEDTAFSDLKFRNIGPAFSSGRIADIAIHPEDENCWYVAVGSGGVWKTENAGVTWLPVFDHEGSYSIGCVTIDPTNPNSVWVGTGENVGGRHVGFGDGIYKSENGGDSWKRMGLALSEHISKIIVHPANPDIVYAAVQGPLWSKGGERGLYRTMDGGATWEKVLGDDEWTGATDIVMDPSDPQRIYAATWQRHRTVAAYMGGGPGSAIYRSTDGGDHWDKSSSGIPGTNLGKIGLAISPFNPDVIYAAIEMDRRTGGIFISEDRGVSWKKQSNTVSGGTGPHYYQELYASPHQEGTLYLMDVYTQVSNDHGKTFRPISAQGMHSDNHAIAFRKSDPDYLLAGTDGGLYESYDLSENWRFVANLPVTQYYKLAVDDAEPFYYIYGGTQDNGSNGGPSRTDNEHGIRNADWFRTLGADGYSTATEPGNPDIFYAEGQEGWMHRIDRITGEQVFIQPQAGEGEPFERFNWDAPILVSPHNPARIYTASYRVWRSDNRGDSWVAISPGLTRDQERLSLPIMGRVQSWDNPWDVYAMSTYNTITSLAESPLQEGLIYAGTDDGIIQVTGDGGNNWRKLEVGSIKGVPSTAFVNDIRADLFDAGTVYLAMDNHKYGDFKPYLFKSTDQGRNWISIAGNLPERTLVWRVVQDHVNPDLLFAATEFGIYFTTNSGNVWTKLTGGVPTISFRDITIQRRENDLVAASFGRGYFILDDYTPLRHLTAGMMDQEGVLFPVRNAWWYIPRNVVSSQGASDYVAENPPYGALFTCYLKEPPMTLKEERTKREKALAAGQADIPFPGWDELDEELRGDQPILVFTVTDASDTVVNRVITRAKKGFSRVNWDLTYASKRPVSAEAQDQIRSSSGYMVTPGTYSVILSVVANGKATQLGEEQRFEVSPLHEGALEGSSFSEQDDYRKALQAFEQELRAAGSSLRKNMERIEAFKQAYFRTDVENVSLRERIYETESILEELDKRLNGSPSKLEIMEKQDPLPGERFSVARSGIGTTYGPTPLHRESLEMGQKELEPISRELAEIDEVILPGIEKELEEFGSPVIEGQ